ncbi:DUF6011 domain-containing protein [Streptomyces sp. NPDC087894]|uniref:DUF6011 domain-containing protein n=1 Tax=Streptomyces sp. NPDC087894 TaxID=3365816 RepID=UPI0038203D36
MDRSPHHVTDTCGVCNRPLLDPESRAAGIGPTCAKKFHSTATAGSHQLTFEDHAMTEDPTPTTTYHPLRFTTPRLLPFARLIDTERQAQLTKFGDQQHPNGTGLAGDREAADRARAICQATAEDGTLAWRHILLEEVHEALAETDPVTLRSELVQVAAVAAAWIADIEQRPRACAHCGDLITGHGHTWTGPVPKPGEDEYLVPRFHLGRPECQAAAEEPS